MGRAARVAPDGPRQVDSGAGGRVAPVVAKLEQDFVAFLERQRLEQTHFFNKVLNDKKEFDVRQQEALNRLVKRQEQETCSLQGGPGSVKSHSGAASPKSAPSRPNSRRPSLKTHTELPSCESRWKASSPSAT